MRALLALKIRPRRKMLLSRPTPPARQPSNPFPIPVLRS